MKRVSELFTAADRQRVNEAVRAAEAETSAEILPVVARSSGRYDRPEDIVGLWFAAVAIVAAWLLVPMPAVEPGNWDAPSPIWQLLALLAAALVGFVAGVLIAMRVDWLLRLFTPRAQMNDEVAARAREVFFDSRVHHTAARSGVLLYVSLFERMAVVLADQSILDRLGQSQVDNCCREFTQRLHDGSTADAICATVDSLGRSLAPLLPRAEDDLNELADALVVID